MQTSSRPRDLIWDQMEAIFGVVPDRTNAHKKRNKAVADLKRCGATPETVRRAHATYGSRFSAPCTDIALATHYPLLVMPETAGERAAFERQQELRERFA